MMKMKMKSTTVDVKIAGAVAGKLVNASVWSSAPSATILRLYPSMKVKPCSFCSCPAISSVPRCPQSTCACLPGAVSKRRTATTRAPLRWGRNQSVRIV
jgi:hypothetical protein